MTEGMPAGGGPQSTGAIVDQAMDEAPQSLFEAAGVPMARTDELLAAVQGPAVRAVLEARIEQIVKHGHDAEHDAAIEPYRLLDKMVEMARVARSRCGVTSMTRESLIGARRVAARCGAMCLAIIDRIDGEIASGDAS